MKVTPGAAKSEIAGFTDGVLRVRLTAPPVEGKANRELAALLSDALGISGSSITLVKGHTGRNKVIAIDGMSDREVMERLSSRLSSGGATTRKPPPQ